MSAVSNKQKRTLDLPLAQFLAIIVLTISVFLIIDFGRRTAASFRIRQERDRLAAQLVRIKTHQAELYARRDYVLTEEYVAQVARQQLKWSLPGETAVVILTNSGPAPGPPASEKPSPFSGPPDTPLEAWWNLLSVARSGP
jgi:cell division protein FtsB